MLRVMQSSHTNCHWLVLLTLEGDWALWRDPSTSVIADVTSPFPPSWNESYICNRDVWMRVSSSKIFSVSLTISLHLSHVNPSSLTERDKLYMWHAVQTAITGEEAIRF